jgi:hypothetical protein
MKTTAEITEWISELKVELTDGSLATNQMVVGVHASIAALEGIGDADELTIDLEINRIKVAKAELMPGSLDEVYASSAISTLEWVKQPSMVAA